MNKDDKQQIIFETPLSPLFCRYNAMMLGIFVAGIMSEFVAPRFQILRQRIQQFLEELSISIPITDDFQNFLQNRFQITDQIRDALAQRSSTILDFFDLASLAFLCTADLSETKLPAADARKNMILRAKEILEKHKLDPMLVDNLSGKVKMSPEGGYDPGETHGYTLEFVRQVLEPLPVNGQTVFVAMPFEEPFLSRFFTFYRPLMYLCECAAIRAWGGFANEVYQPLLYTLIRKSGLFLAELTTANLNVINEVGIATGLNHTTVLLAEKGTIIPTNLGHRPILEYNPQDPQWPHKEINRLFPQLEYFRLEVDLWQYKESSEKRKPQRHKDTEEDF